MHEDWGVEVRGERDYVSKDRTQLAGFVFQCECALDLCGYNPECHLHSGQQQ
jgi:hypothetical protein